MLILLLAIWFILNGKFTLEIALFGLGVCLVVYFFLCKFTYFSFKKDIRLVKNFFLIIAYFFVLIKEVIVANFSTLKVILSKKDKAKPEIVHLHLGIKSEFLKTLVANSITLTPGTISVDLEDDDFTVYCLQKKFIQGFENSTLVKLARKMEARNESNS